MSQTPVPVSLSSAATVYAISNTGTAVPDGGFDYSSNAYSEALLGGSLTWSGATFTLGAAGVPSGVRSGRTISAARRQFCRLCAAWPRRPFIQQSNLPVFMITYTDGSTTTVTQSAQRLDLTPQHYAGEIYRPGHALSDQVERSPQRYCRLYVYSLARSIDHVAKTVAKLTVPKDADLTVMAVDLVP